MAAAGVAAGETRIGVNVDPSMPVRRIQLAQMSFRIAGVEVSIHPSWFVAFGILALLTRARMARSTIPASGGWLILFSFAVIFMLYVCVLLHELSHALVARAHGMDARRVTLFIFGGVAQIGGEAQRPEDEFRIAIAGPLASLLVAGILAGVARTLHPNADGLEGLSGDGGLWGSLALINLALALFNLIPAFPLDGGRILRSGLWWGLGDRARATRFASNLGRGFAFLLIGAGGAIAATYLIAGEAQSASLGVWWVLIGYFLFTIAGTAGRAEGGAEPHRSEPPAKNDTERTHP